MNVEDMQSLETKPAAPSFARYVTLGGRLSPRGVLLVLAAAAAVAGVYGGWDWLVAAGVAPILLVLAPCAVMCALGVCAHKLGAKDK